MSKKFDEEWVDVKDDDGDWGDDDGVIDDDYDEDKFQREYEQYMKSLSKSTPKSTTSVKSSSTTSSNTTTSSATSNSTPSTQSVSSATDVTSEKKDEKSHSKHHHKRNVAHLKDHHHSSPSTPPIKPAATPVNTDNTPKSTTTETTSSSNTPAVTKPTVTTTTATTPTITKPIVNQQQTTPVTSNEVKTSTQPTTTGQSGVSQNERKYEKRDIKQHKPQNERKKHRSEQETVEFIKTLLSKLLSSYDKVYASTRLTPDLYENTRHKLLKNFSFHKNSETMQTLWIDILLEKVLERGIAGTIGGLLHEQLEENVSRLPQDVIFSLKKKIATKCERLFKEEFIVQNKEKELEEEFKSFKKKSNTLKLVAKLISCHVLEKKIAFLIINSLLGNPTELNLKLVCEFLLEVGYKIDSPSTKTLMDGIMNLITTLSKSDNVSKLTKLDLLNVIDSRERNKFANIDEQFMFIQHELKVIQLENELAELTEKPEKPFQHNQ